MSSNTEFIDAGLASLLARRIPRSEIEVGRAYVIHARNGGVGIADLEDCVLGYCLHREKFGDHYLFVEYDWDEDTPHGTAIPLRLLPDVPPNEAVELLNWLADRELEHQDEIRTAWATRRALAMRNV